MSMGPKRPDYVGMIALGLLICILGSAYRKPAANAAQDKSSIPSEPQQEVESQLLEEQILDVLNRDDRLTAAIKKMIADEVRRQSKLKECHACEGDCCDSDGPCPKGCPDCYEPEIGELAPAKPACDIYRDDWFEGRSPSLQTALLELMPPDSPERIRREKRLDEIGSRP